MFFNFIRRNSQRIRKENGIYFASLIVSIVAFYVILSLGDQNVMHYLKTIESDAVERLLLLIPVLYAVSLVFVFFLVYFANRYQLQQRSHEFGMYVMLGMGQRKLFLMIFAESMWNSMLSLFIGLPIALFLTEIINLTTSRLVGVGIAGHTFHISAVGISLTVCGFLIVQCLVMLILSVRMSRKEPFELLYDNKEKTQTTLTSKWSVVNIVSGATVLCGTIFLCVSYALAVLYFRHFDYRIFALIIVLGFVGTFILFRGLSSLVGIYIKRNAASKTGLSLFTMRQLQENVLHQWSSLAISSLLILMAIVCFTFGTSNAITNAVGAVRTVDYTFNGDKHSVEAVIQSPDVAPYVEQFYAMAVHYFYDKGIDATLNFQFEWAGLLDAIAEMADSEKKRMLLHQFSQKEGTYFISLASYNDMLQAAGKAPLILRENEVAMYSSDTSWSADSDLKELLQHTPTIEIANNTYTLMPNLYSDPIVADRAITLTYALIVPDSLFKQYFKEPDTWLWNMILQEDFVAKKGLMQAMLTVDNILKDSDDISFESYLSSMGRQLFYTVAATYTTFYLGVMFLLIANTVLGLNFLMKQRSTRRRYETLFMLGASISSICYSARQQITLYFILVLSVALISGIFGIWALTTAMPALAFSMHNVIAIVIVILLFIVIEVLYIRIIQRKSDTEIRKLTDME